MPLHSSLSHLPLAYFLLAPELEQLAPPEEKRSDCSACPMQPQPDESDPPLRITFDSRVRCCTYNPWLMNFLVGRVLRRGGRGAAQIRKRMADPTGVNPYAIRPPPSFYEKYHDRTAERFGNDLSIRCPYWVPDDNGQHCTVWADRNAVCRTWFCKHDGGAKAAVHWNAFRELISTLQVLLCRWLVKIGDPPEEGRGKVRDWARWYLWCADRLDRATLSELRAFDDKPLHQARQLFRETWSDLHRQVMPSVLGPSVRNIGDVDDERIILQGYSVYNPIILPRTIFLLFSKMDGTVTWRQALERTKEELGSEVFTEEHIQELFRLGILEARKPEDLIPGARISGRPIDAVMKLENQKLSVHWSYETDEPAGTARLELP